MNNYLLNFIICLIIFIWSNFYLFLYPIILQYSQIYDVQLIRDSLLFFEFGNSVHTIRCINLPSIVSLIGMIINGYAIFKRSR